MEADVLGIDLPAGIKALAVVLGQHFVESDDALLFVAGPHDPDDGLEVGQVSLDGLTFSQISDPGNSPRATRTLVPAARQMSRMVPASSMGLMGLTIPAASPPQST